MGNNSSSDKKEKDIVLQPAGIMSGNDSELCTDAEPFTPETLLEEIPAANSVSAVGGNRSSVQSSSSSNSIDKFKATNYLEDNHIDAKIENYIKSGLMDFELKYGFKDAFIICCDADQKNVIQFRDSIENSVVLNNHEKPKIVLLSEIAQSVGGTFRALEFGLERCTFVFLYITSSFVKDAWAEYSSETCLMEAIENPQRRWSVVPIFTDDRSYKIPISINTLKGLAYSNDDQFYKDAVKRLLEERISVRKQKELKNKQIQIKWISNYEQEMEIDKQEETTDSKHMQASDGFSSEKLQARNEMINEFASKQHHVLSPSIDETCKQVAPEDGMHKTKDSESVEAALSEMSISHADNRDTETVLNTSRSVDNSNVQDGSHSSSVDLDSDISVDASSKSESHGSNIHHHHYHYHVNAKNVQIGEKNKLVTKVETTEKMLCKGDEEMEEDKYRDDDEYGTIKDNMDSGDRAESNILEKYGISPHKANQDPKDPDQTFPKELDS